MATVTDAYPMTVCLTGKRCVVVGGGAVASRKVEGLLAAGADDVVVVAPRACPTVEGRAQEGRVTWRARPFRADDLDGAALAFVATADREVNAAATAAARGRGVWVNVADRPEESDFHVPAVLRRGGVSVAVSTGGASPALAAWIRDGAGGALPERVEELARLTRALRERTRGDGGSGERFRRLFAAGVADDLARGDWQEVDRKVSECFGLRVSARALIERPPTEAT